LWAGVVSDAKTTSKAQLQGVKMAKRGWSETELMQMKAENFCYSPSRNSLISPIVSSDDEEFN
jgi:hypothetical protein